MSDKTPIPQNVVDLQLRLLGMESLYEVACAQRDEAIKRLKKVDADMASIYEVVRAQKDEAIKRIKDERDTARRGRVDDDRWPRIHVVLTCRTERPRSGQRSEERGGEWLREARRVFQHPSGLSFSRARREGRRRPMTHAFVCDAPPPREWLAWGLRPPDNVRVRPPRDAGQDKDRNEEDGR